MIAALLALLLSLFAPMMGDTPWQTAASTPAQHSGFTAKPTSGGIARTARSAVPRSDTSTTTPRLATAHAGSGSTAAPAAQDSTVVGSTPTPVQCPAHPQMSDDPAFADCPVLPGG